MDNVSNSTVKNIFENGMIPKLIKKNGPPQCGIYTLGQLSKLYVLIRLEETNTNRSQERILLFLIDSIRWYGLKFSNPEAFPFLSAFIIPLGIMVNYGDLQFAERIMVARRSEMSAEWKVRFAICIASVAIQAFTKLLFSLSDVLKVTNCTFQEVDTIFRLAVGDCSIWWILLLYVCCWMFVCIGCFCTSYIVSNHRRRIHHILQCQLQDGKYFHSVVMFYLRKRITLKICIWKKKSNLFSCFCRLIENKIFLLITFYKHDCNSIL